MSALRCFHCREPVPPEAVGLSVVIAGVDQPMCCRGCQAVAQAIVDAGAQAYYEQRAVPALDPQRRDQLSPWADLLGDPAFTSRHVLQAETPDGEAVSETTLAVEGLRCGACAWLIERILTRQQGVVLAKANATNARLFIRWRPEQVGLQTLCGLLRAVGYITLPVGSLALEATRKAHARSDTRRLFVSGFLAMQVMMLAMPEYVAGAQLEAETRELLRWASMLLTIPALLYSGDSFSKSALRALGQRRLNMDVPISLGLWLAFLGSVASLLMEGPHVYFESVTMFVFLVLGARHLEARMRTRTLLRREAIAHQPPTLAHRISPPAATLPAWELRPGDDVKVPTGERFPADAILKTDQADLDLSALTGELHPVPHALGDLCPEGAINLGREALATVASGCGAGTLARLSQLTEQAAAQRPDWTSWADRVAGRFTLGVLIIAATTVAYGWLQGEPVETWLPRLVAVLVVSCPCALSLAGPAAYAGGLGALLEKGIAVSNPNALAKAWALRTLVFDKTGTLTEPALANIRVHWADATGTGAPALQWARVLALTDESHHPLARAMRLHARAALAACTDRQAEPLPVTERQAFAGLGLQARDAQGRLLQLGAMGFVGAKARLAKNALFEGDPPSLALAIDGEPLGFFWLDDTLRPEALQTMASVRRLGIDTWLLSGDQSSRVQSVAQQLGFPAAQAQGPLRPEDKLSALQALQTQQAGVGMVGDGLNDAPVMAAADVSWAMHGSASLAQQRADIYLLQPGLEGVVHTLTMARRTRRILFQNIFWAVGYNIIAIPLAALGLIPPVWAAIGMASSSLVVMLNAARLLPQTWTSSRSSS